MSTDPRRVETVNATYLGGRGFTIMTDLYRHELPMETARRVAAGADDGATLTDAGRAVERPTRGA